MSAPELSRADLEAPIRRRFENLEGRRLLAIYGQIAQDDALDVDGLHVQILRVRSELDLRRRMLELQKDDCAVFVIPWRATDLPMDVRGRFKKTGRIEIVGPGELLAARFGATEVDDEARDSPLAPFLLKHHTHDSFASPGGRLTVDTLWTAWLARAWSLDTGGELGLDALLGWAAVDARGPQFVAAMTERSAGNVKTALHEYLGKRLGPAGPVVWRAWESGQGRGLLELALVIGALAGSTDPAVQMWIKLTTKQQIGVELDEAVLRRLGDTADAALRFLSRRDRGEATVRAIVLAADQRASIPEVQIHVSGSTRLPSAWRARLDRLGRALGEIATAPSAAAVEAAVAASREVWHHEMARDSDQAPVLRQAEMTLRLASWLAVRPDRDLPPAVTPYDDVENLAGWYAREGGYLDRARRWARGGGEGAFAAGVKAVLDAVDAVRVELDRRFARALPDWHRAGRRATQVVPIDQALHRIATAFLDEKPDRKLLVVLMDGMAWAQAVELLESMGNRASVWGPLAWHGMAKHRIGDGPYPPVLTNFPTITEVSRSAFFGGKVIPPGAATNASGDPERWKANRDVLKHTKGNAVPQLRLRGDGQLKDGSAAPDALELVMDPQQRIVAVVINAIDMSLKADRAHEVEWKLETVKALRDLLDKATSAGRAVLLCSDHGHVPADRLEKTGAPSVDGSRWRQWQGDKDPIADYEIGLVAGDGVWAPRGVHGIALLADDAHRHGGGTGSGEHGGASLAEVVAPCVLIGCADVDAASSDDGQAVRPAVAPSWWFFDVGDAGAPEALTGDRPKKPRKGAKRPSDAQEFLPTFTPKPETPAPVAMPVVSPAPESALAKSELFLARAPEAKARAQAVRAVEFLRARKGVASAAAFASELGEFAARVGGVVAKLQEMLNVDGYQVLKFDRAGQQVILDVEMLVQQFEL